MSELMKKKYGNLMPKRVHQINEGGRKYFDSADDPKLLARSTASATSTPAPTSQSAALASSQTHHQPPSATSSPAEAGRPTEPTTVPTNCDSLASAFEAALSTEEAHSHRGSFTGSSGSLLNTSHNSATHSGPRILVVDHVEASSRMMQLSLIKAKFTADVCSTGEEMVSRAHSYRAVLFNLQMPDMPVLDAIRRIRAADNDSAQVSQSGSPSSARAPVLLFGVGESNKMTVEELQPFIEAGLDGYVFSGSIIGKELTNFLQQKKTNPSQFLLSHGH